MGVKDRIKAFEKSSSTSGSPKATTTSPPRSSDANVKDVQDTSSPPTKPEPVVASPPTNVNGAEAAAELQQQQQNEGVEILDSAISTTSTAITHKLDKKNVQLNALQEEEPTKSSDIPPMYQNNDGMENEGTSMEELHPSAQAMWTKLQESVAAEVTKNEKGEEEEPYDEMKNDALLPMTHVEHDNSTPDDVSSIHHSLADEEKRSPKRGGGVGDQSSKIEEGLPVHHEEEDSFDDELHQKALQRRNILIIIFLLIFLGLVGAIGAGIGAALKNNPSKQQPPAQTEDKYGGVGGGIDEDDVFATPAPSSAPSYDGPCIGLEVGIIFDKYAAETSWKLLAGETDEVVWKSNYYGSNYDDDWDIFRKCFPPGPYTFVFMDREGDGICCSHGEGKYILSSEGKVIAVGGQMVSKEERTSFELEFVEPIPTDSNGDGLDDRLGVLMPYDSSKLVEGETCENFRLVFETDQYGIETGWELYEGPDRVRENRIANGTSYGSEHTYVVDYCLPSQRSYSLYMYDWKGDGLCCDYGQGWYKVSSGDITIYESDGKFEDEDVVRFVLPADGTFIETAAPTTASPTTPKPTPLPTPLPPTRSPTQRPTTPPPVMTNPPSLSPTPPATPPPVPFTLPFITLPPSAAPMAQGTTQLPTVSGTTISTSSPTQQPSETSSTSPSTQPSAASSERKMCSFCTGVEMKDPDKELYAGQTCQTVQAKAITLTASDETCALLKLVEEDCCKIRRENTV
jgi:hypothetical protein